MSLFSQLLGVNTLFLFLGLILYVLFGQLTVRRLRKNPNTKESLGIGFVSGWDILNVAQVLSLPRAVTKRLEKSPLSPVYAKYECLRENTTPFDRVLAAIFYWVFMVSSLSMILLVALNGLGVF